MTEIIDQAVEALRAEAESLRKPGDAFHPNETYHKDHHYWQALTHASQSLVTVWAMYKERTRGPK